MAYTDKQKSEHIREAQRYIYGISFHNKRIPRVIPDGIYGEKTAEAVRIFQEEYGLKPTNEIDNATWNRLDQVCSEYTKDIVLLDVFPENYVIKPGDRGAVVYIIQVILNTLSVRFSNIPSVELSGVYDESTAEAMREFRKTAALPPFEGIDLEAWNKLASGFNMMKKNV